MSDSVQSAGTFALEEAAPGSDRVGDGPAVGLWLLACCAMVFAMFVIGAVTRLTESGLSIMEWAPLTGTLPPLSAAEWDRLFALYKETGEYRAVNAGMSLAAFKTIFWWEYIHRLWGRLIGLAFFLPLLWFWLRGRLPARLRPHLLAALALGGLQGLVGWYMVSSGFAARTDVSQYRLVAHLLLATAIYGYLLWLTFATLWPDVGSGGARAAAPGLRGAVRAFAVLVLVTVASGGFVAGLNAGLVYNSVPYMGDGLVPAEYLRLEPWYANLFENVAAVQFNHRILAVATVAAALLLWLVARRGRAAPAQGGAIAAIAAIALAQLGLGLATLLMAVPVWLGALHQAGALTLLTATVWALHTLRSETRIAS